MARWLESFQKGKLSKEGWDRDALAGTTDWERRLEPGWWAPPTNRKSPLNPLPKAAGTHSKLQKKLQWAGKPGRGEATGS